VVTWSVWQAQTRRPKPVTIASYQVKAGDVVQVREKSRKQLRIQGALASATQAGLPEWVEVNDKEMRGVFKAVPAREDVLPDVNENLVVEFDLDQMKVIKVVDSGVVPIPPRSANYSAAALADPDNIPHLPAGPRQDLRPIDIVQSEGPSFTVDGNQVEWQKWRLRIGFTQREGLVLHLVEYNDQGRWRPIIYRASLSEMFIPYGDPNPNHYRKNVFDMGEFGLGIWTNSLELGCDCLGEIAYLDATVTDDTGAPRTIANAICRVRNAPARSSRHGSFPDKAPPPIGTRGP